MSYQYPEVIVYAYDMAPNPQKLFQFLAFFNIPYKYVEIPVTMPRPTLAELGISYRRTPLLSIGSDMYIDNALIVSKLSVIAQDAPSDLADSTNHLEYDALGQLGFQCGAGLIPSDKPMMHDPAFLADRSELMGRPFDPAALARARPHIISKMLSLLSVIQRNFLRDGRRFVLGGSTPTTADMHLYWSVNWGLRQHEGARPEVSESTHPVIFAWLAAVEAFIADRKVETKIQMDEACEVLRRPTTGGLAEVVPHVHGNPEGLSKGQTVKVTPADTGRSCPQMGELITLNYEQVCLRNEKGLVMHFPRLGYEVVAEA